MSAIIIDAMRRPIDNIEIKDPPLEELTRKHSCVKRTCLTCLTFLIVLICASLIILKFTIGPKTTALKTLPREFTRAIPVYDADNVEQISFTSGDKRSRGVESAAFVPKLIVAPLLLIFDKENNFVRRYRPELANELNKNQTAKKRFLLFMRQQLGDHRDLIKIDWLGQTADRDFISDYYETELKKKNFTVSNHSESTQISQFTFSKEDIDGVLYIKDDPQTDVTDAVSMTVTMDINL